MIGPDFSQIDSKEKAEELFRNGELEKLFLLPLEFGGQDIPQNVVYVPATTVEAKAGIDFNIIQPLVAQGKICRYDVTPEYQGDSFIPISLTVKGWDPGQFNSKINVWGDALK